MWGGWKTHTVLTTCPLPPIPMGVACENYPYQETRMEEGMTIEELEKRVRMLEDREEIKELHREYLF